MGSSTALRDVPIGPLYESSLNTTLAVTFRAPGAMRPARRPFSVTCDRADIWHRNLALQQEHQTRAERLRQAIYIRNVEPPTPTVALLHSQLRAAEAARCIAAQKVALLQAEAAGHRLSDVPPTIRETAIDAVAQLSRLRLACDAASDSQRLWGRWTLIRPSAPGAFKPVSLQAFCGDTDAQEPFEVQGVVRALTLGGSYCDTLVLGALPHDPVGTAHGTGQAEIGADDSLRLTPQWLSCRVPESLSTDVCQWQMS